LLIILSIRNAALDIYPLSSNSEIPKNKTKINGKNGNVPPKEPKIPSTINDLNQALEWTKSPSTGAII